MVRTSHWHQLGMFCHLLPGQYVATVEAHHQLELMEQSQQEVSYHSARSPCRRTLIIGSGCLPFSEYKGSLKASSILCKIGWKSCCLFTLFRQESGLSKFWGIHWGTFLPHLWQNGSLGCLRSTLPARPKVPQTSLPGRPKSPCTESPKWVRVR